MYARDGPSTTLAGSQLLGSKTRNQLMSIHRNCGKVGLKLCTPPSVEKMQHCRLALSVILNPQLNPQNAMSSTTSANFGSPRGSCKSL